MSNTNPQLHGLEREQEIARVLRPLIRDDVHSRDAMVRAAARLGMSVANAYRKRKALETSALSSVLTPKKRGPPPGRRYLRPDIERVIDDVLKDFFFKRQKPTIQAALQECHDRCKLEGIERSDWPSRTALTKRIKEKGLYHLLLRREGKEAARASKPQPGEFVADRPNHYWLIDHTSADIMLVDRIRRLVLGRPTLTLVIDAFSRLCMGFYVSFDPPSRVHAAMALVHAIFPKDAWLEQLGIPHAWPARGTPDNLHSDNAAEFRSVVMRRGLALLNIEPQYRDPDETQQGGLIERFVGSMMGDVHLLPGTTFSNVKARGTYDSEKAATMTLDAFVRWFALNVIRYNNTPHRGLQELTPTAVWQAACEAGWAPRTVGNADSAKVFIGFLPHEVRAVRPEGLRFAKRRYWADWLGELVLAGRRKAEVRYDPRDISRLWVEDADGAWRPVPFATPSGPISLAEQQAINAALRAQGLAAVDEEAMFQARQQQAAVLKEEAAKSRAARRTVERRERAISESRRSLQAADEPAPAAPAPPSSSRGFSTAIIDASDVEAW